MVGFAVGLGSFAQGMANGMQMAQQVRGALDARKMRKVEKEGAAAATAAREKDIMGAISTETVDQTAALSATGQSISLPTSATYKVDGKAYDSMADARKAAEAQVGTVMDYYRSTTVPKLIQGYIDIGQTDKAAQLQSWMETQDSNRITKDWAKAMRLGMIGDTKGAMRGFGKLYERLEPGSRYIGTEDITEPVYEDIVGKDGKTSRTQTGTRTTGMRLKLRNVDGEDISHDFGGQEDLFNTAMFTLSPDKFADRVLGQVDAAVAARGEAAKEDRKFQRDLQRDKYKAVLDDQRDERQAQRGIIRDDRQAAHQAARDATLSGYRQEETTTELQMRAALKLSEATGESPEDVRKSIETITKRFAETDMNFAKLSPEEQTARAVQVLNAQRSSARGVIGAGQAAPADQSRGVTPRLW